MLNPMAAQGSIGWFTVNGKSRVCMQTIPMQSRTSNPLHSKLSLVQTDSEMNAEGAFAEAKGIGGVRKYGYNRFGALDEDIVGNRVDQSMSKVEAWSETFDAKNVSVCAGQVHGVREMTHEALLSL
jgi:hypothetical protein